MFSSKIKKVIKFPVLLLIMGVLSLGFVCAGMFHERSTEVDTMTSSPTLTSIVGEESCCGTNMSQHIESWRNTFLALPQAAHDSLVLLALGPTLILAYSWFSFRDRYPALYPDIGRSRLYIRENPDIATFNHLKLAFMRGILNPKIYQ